LIETHMCKLEEEEKVLPTFELEKHCPELEKNIKDLLLGSAQFDKLEPLTVSPHITERFLNTKANSSKPLTVRVVFSRNNDRKFSQYSKKRISRPRKKWLTHSKWECLW